MGDGFQLVGNWDLFCNGGEAMIIHYCTKTGTITSWGNGEPPDDKSHFPGHELLRLEEHRDIDPIRHRIDLATKTLTERDPADQQALQSQALARDLSIRIAHELSATDGFMAPDRPMTDGMRQRWRVFRQALRDLSKLPTPAAQLAAWPASPAQGDTDR
jgi:hypothetical protein